MELGRTLSLCYREGPLGRQEEGRGGAVCEQPAGGPPLPHLADRRGGRGLAAGPDLLAELPAPQSSLTVLIPLFFVRRWWERGLWRPTLAQSRPSPEPRGPR